MDILCKDKNGIAVVELSGRFDAGAVDDFKQRVSDKVAEGCRRFVADLSGVEFLDSSGLGALVAVLRSIADKDGDMKIAAPGPEVMALFELTRLNKVFDILPSVDDAVASYS